MKNAFLIFLFLSLSGCAAVSQWTNAQKECASDPACLEDVKSYAKIGEVVASPFGPVAGGAASACIIFIGLGVLGLRKKKE